MADERMPEEMIAWMEERNWGTHHVQWHFERRWDLYQAWASQGDEDAKKAVEEAVANGWTRSSLQEGEMGNGEDFLFMHRAMLHLLSENFPRLSYFIRGWAAIPRQPDNADDAVPPNPPKGDPNPSKGLFHPKMDEAIRRIEAGSLEFGNEDDFGLFLQTAMRPTAEDPFKRSEDEAAGLHNYLHNRWSDNASEINIGDPAVNIQNHRFWKLHGWIDFQWWRFRRMRGLSESEGDYQGKLKLYIDMMGHAGHHHLAAAETAPRATRNFFAQDFPR